MGDFEGEYGIQVMPAYSVTVREIYSFKVCQRGGIQYIFQVTTTPTSVRNGSIGNRRRIYIKNKSGVTIYYGFNDLLDTSNSQILANNEERVFNLMPEQELYVCTASGTANINVLELWC